MTTVSTAVLWEHLVPSIMSNEVFQISSDQALSQRAKHYVWGC